MTNRNLKKYLVHSLGLEVQPKRLDETIKYCTEIMQENSNHKEEPRTGFLQYLSDVFRYEGIPIFVLQGITLLFVCLTIANMADIPQIYRSLCRSLYWLPFLYFLKVNFMG